MKGLAILVATSFGCGENPEIVIPPGSCQPPGDAAWYPQLLDLSDPGAPEADPELFGDCLENGNQTAITPHHDSLSPVHAVHMPTPPNGELLLFHGRSEERVWPNLTSPSEALRYPIPFCVPWTHPARCLSDGTCDNVDHTGGAACDEHTDCSPYEVIGYPDVFCGAHQLLESGEVLIAGGNVTGGGDAGLYEAFLFDPRIKSAVQFPYGWARVGGATPENMDVDRWYPTLTGLPDGRVLISGGAGLDADDRNSFEVFDPSAPVGDQITQLPDDVDFDENFGGTNISLYPFMFVLPNGDIVYAGGEAAEEVAAYHARILVPDYDDLENWQWANFVGMSSIPGGSAVMYEPGKIMKSGGTITGSANATDITETLDLSGFQISNLYPPGMSFTPHLGPDAMVRPRHFHTLTLLPDGRVLATGGNMRGNDNPGDRVSNPCDSGGQLIRDMPCEQGCPSECLNTRCTMYEGVMCTTDSDCPNASTCQISDACLADGSCGCFKSCSDNADCPSIVDNDVCWTTSECSPGKTTEVCTTQSELRCDPGNNACFATYSAEIWDPACEAWTEYDTQQRPRMYHSVAMLMPDSRVISTGGGHERGGLVDQTNAEFFEIDYPAGQVPVVTVADDAIDNAEDYTVHMPYAPSTTTILLENAAAQSVSRVTLVRLGSVTHQFDMGQRFIELPASSEGPSLILTGPPTFQGDFSQSAVAPPGYYMLFVWSDAGVPSQGQYVHLGDPAMAMFYACVPGPEFEASETSCRVEPVGGVCPASAREYNAVALPLAESRDGTIEGWNVHVPPGLVRDPDADLAAIEGLCVDACEAEWADEPAIAASCRDLRPELVDEGSESALDLVIASQQDGSGIFDGQRLTCRLGEDCCSAFDEALCAAAPDRKTTADAPLGRGEEYLVALGEGSSVEVITNTDTFASPVTGSIGYSFCTDGSESCPFYVGSFEARASSPIRTTMRCADGSWSEHVIDEFVTRLAQPAFGIAEDESARKGFPAGALLFDGELVVDGLPFELRRPSSANVVMTARATSIEASDLSVTATVPCNDSTTEVTVRYTVRDDGRALGEPPVVTIGVPDSLRCGTTSPLTARVTDADGDHDTTRWYVDGVLMSPGTASMTFSRTHELRAVARDLRGATTTATKIVRCS